MWNPVDAFWTFLTNYSYRQCEKGHHLFLDHDRCQRCLVAKTSPEANTRSASSR